MDFDASDNSKTSVLRENVRHFVAVLSGKGGLARRLSQSTLLQHFQRAVTTLDCLIWIFTDQMLCVCLAETLCLL